MKTERDLPAERLSEGNPDLVKVLMYHRIVKDEALSRASWLCVHTNAFRKQLELLDRWGYTTITFDDYRLFLGGDLNLPRKPVILTFDDGYLDTYHQAFPLLYEFGMKAVIFVVGDRRLRANLWDRDAEGIPEALLMEDHHIMDLHETGFEIGAHTMTHARLPQLQEDEAWREVAQSKISLENLLHASVRSFAYPYGLVDDRTKQMVVRAGFDMAYSTGTGPATFGKDPYEIRRTTIRNTTGSMGFGLKVMAHYQLYEWTRWQARRAYYALSGKRRSVADPVRNTTAVPRSINTG